MALSLLVAFYLLFEEYVRPHLEDSETLENCGWWVGCARQCKIVLGKASLRVAT